MLHTKNELQSMKCGVSNLTVLLEARTKFIQTGLVDVSKEKIIENLCEIISTIHSNLDIANKSVIPFLFTISNNSLGISNVICLVNPQNGNWVFFTISQNSLY